MSNVTLAVPTLSLLTLISLTALGIGQTAVILALTVFAIPPLLANAYTGLREVDPQVRDAARGMGLSGWQMLWRVELPLSVPYLAAGFRTAAVQVVARSRHRLLERPPHHDEDFFRVNGLGQKVVRAEPHRFNG